MPRHRPSNLRTASLPEVLSVVVDNRGRSCPTVPDGFPLIATNCIKEDRLHPVFEKVRYISEETRRDWFRAHPKSGDVIFTCKGTPGKVAMVPDPVPFAIAQDMVALRSDPEVMDSRFLYYLLSAPDSQAQIANLHVGSLIPHFKKGDFGKLILTFPSDLNEQRRIAGVLGALDALVEADLRIAADCRELRQSLIGRALDSAAVEEPLSHLARFVNGKNFTKEASGTGRPVIRTPELRSGPSANTVWNDVDADSDFVARPGDVLFVWSGSLMVDRWIHADGLINQHIFKVIPNAGVPDWLIFSLVERQMPWFTGLAADKATTMGHITRAHLEAAVPLPTPDEVDKLCEQVEPLWSAEFELRREALQLACARDELLPLLMSGRVRVKDVAA